MTSGLDVAQDMICSSIPDPHLLLSCKNMQTMLLYATAGVHFSINQSSGSSLAHHEQSHFIFGHRLQVGNRERLGEGGASSEGLGRLDCCGEAVQPRPLAGTPHSCTRLWWAVAERRRHRGAAQELVQVETHSQGGEALHVGTVDELLPTYNVRLEGERNRNISSVLILFAHIYSQITKIMMIEMVLHSRNIIQSTYRASLYLLVGILFLQHHRQSLQEGPHAGSHVEANHTLLLQSRAARGEHMVGRHELFEAIHHQHILEVKQTRESVSTDLILVKQLRMWRKMNQVKMSDL